MKTLSPEQLTQLNEFLKTYSSYPLRDLLLISMSVNAGIRLSHLAALKVKDVINQTTGQIALEVPTSKSSTPLPEQVRQELNDYLTSRFHQSLSSLIDVSLPLFTNRQEPRTSFSDQSMSSHLTYLLREAGIDASSGALRNTFIVNVGRKATSIAHFFRITGVRDPSTYLRLMTEEVVTSELIEA